MREGAAVARLQDRRLDLEEALRVEIAPDRGDHLRAQAEELPRVLVHEQVEVALAVPRLDIREAVERVGKGAGVPGEDRQLVDRERRLAAARLRGSSGHPDDVPEMHVHVADPAGVAHELHASRAVDEIEEDELAHLAARHDAAGEAPRLVELGSGVDPVGRCPNVGDGVSIGEPLMSRHGGRV